MRSINSSAVEKDLTFRPKILFRLLYVIIPCIALVAGLIYQEKTRVHASPKVGQGYIVAIAIFSIGIFVGAFLICRKVIVYPECLSIIFVFPYQQRENYTWKAIGDVTEKYLLFIGKVFVLHRVGGEKHGVFWLSGWRHSRELKRALIEKVQENGGRYIKEPFLPIKKR